MRMWAQYTWYVRDVEDRDAELLVEWNSDYKIDVLDVVT